MKIAHIINPFKAKESQDLYLAQPVTFESMRVSQQLAQNLGIDVELYAAFFPEDEDYVPENFIRTPPLDRSVLDVAKQEFKIPRRFPLIKEILDRLYQATSADCLIYTNVDIALMPSFYCFVHQNFLQGIDAFSITRRTLLGSYSSINDLPLMYAEYGEAHPGHDCFVFARKAYPEYHLNTTCIGVRAIGSAMIVNMASHSDAFKVFRKLHLTFHLGNDRRYSPEAYSPFEDYLSHNIKNFEEIVAYYKSCGLLSNHKLVEHIISRLDIE